MELINKTNKQLDLFKIKIENEVLKIKIENLQEQNDLLREIIEQQSKTIDVYVRTNK